MLLDHAETVGDPLCGGFLSWRTLQQLQALGVDPFQLGGHRITHLRLFSAGRTATTSLPQVACGLSRHALDSALRAAALDAGAQMAFDHITAVEQGVARGKKHDWRSETLFLASGKHDLRGAARPRRTADPALGLRLRLAPTRQRAEMLGDHIELHLFAGGYVGMVLQEDGTANLCLALRKSALTRAGGSPHNLLAELAARDPAMAARLGDDWAQARIETIGAVPYGWIAEETADGLYRIGDQAAVIPSLAGEGIGIALASGQQAASYWLELGPAGAARFQRAFAQKARRPVQVARVARGLAESPLGGLLAIFATERIPATIHALARMSRIETAPTAIPATNSH